MTIGRVGRRQCYLGRAPALGASGGHRPPREHSSQCRPLLESAKQPHRHMAASIPAGKGQDTCRHLHPDVIDSAPTKVCKAHWAEPGIFSAFHACHVHHDSTQQWGKPGKTCSQQQGMLIPQRRNSMTARCITLKSRRVSLRTIEGCLRIRCNFFCPYKDIYTLYPWVEYQFEPYTLLSGETVGGYAAKSMS